MASSILMLGGCSKKEINAPERFDIDAFEQNLIDYVNWGNDQPIGWAYTISQQGQLKRSNAYGLARLPIDGQQDFTVNKEINVASISKFYTAIAALQLIEANGLTIDSKIASWLPASWTKGPGVNNLTFKDLLKHESGLQSTNSNFDNTLGYEGLKTCIQTGVVNAKTRNYLNVNFALFRVLIPSLWKPLSDNAIDVENDANTQFMYLLYLQENIFDRIDLPLVGCTPEAWEDATLYYNVNDFASNTAGVYYSSWNNKCGGGGYFMSPMEMAKVNAYFEHTDVLLSNDMKQVMKTHRLGLDSAPSASLEIHGKYYGKNGSISNGNGQGILGQIAMFPINGVDCVVIMNTQGVTLRDDNNNNSLSRMIYKAYNDAWK